MHFEDVQMIHSSLALWATKISTLANPANPAKQRVHDPQVRFLQHTINDPVRTSRASQEHHQHGLGMTSHLPQPSEV